MVTGKSGTGLALAAMSAMLLASGCQTRCDECGYVEIVAANYRAIASCVAGQEIEAKVESRAGVTVDSNRPSGALGGPEIVEDDPSARRIVIDVNRYTASGYRLIFTGLAERSTEVRGQALGELNQFFWPEQVGPLVARCSGRIPG